LFTNAGL